MDQIRRNLLVAKSPAKPPEVVVESPVIIDRWWDYSGPPIPPSRQLTQLSSASKPRLDVTRLTAEGSQANSLWRTREEVNALIYAKCSDVLAKLKRTQIPPVLELVYRYGELPATHIEGGNSQIIAPTGTGKTYVMCAATKILREIYPDKFPLNRYVLILCPQKAVQQTMKVLTLKFQIFQNVLVRSLDSMRAGFGDAFVQWNTVIINGQPVLYPFWTGGMAPCLIWLDESQKVKNSESTQAQIIESAGAMGIPVVPLSATPYSRVVQAKIIACLLAPRIEFGADKHATLDVIKWPSWSKIISRPANPLEWSPKALRELQRWLEPKTIRFTCEYPHPIISKLAACQFATVASRSRYMDAFDNWQRIREEQEKNPLVGMAAVLVALQKFLQVAEEERAPLIARYAYKQLLEHENNPKKRKISIILGFAFRTALNIALATLKEMGVNDNDIALIVGGQTEQEVDRNHTRFQSDRARILLLTIACGGAALSLDHNPFNKRQRWMYCSAVWNDIQMAQLSGRTQRVDTQSASYMVIMYYEGTEEIRRIQKMRRKLRSLKEITTKVSVTHARDGESATFVDDIDKLSVESMGTLLTPEEQEAIEMAEATRMIGSGDSAPIVLEDEDNDQ